MKITWLDIKESMNRLMFLDQTEYNNNEESFEYKNSNEYAAHIVEAANYAQNELAKIFPVKGVYDDIIQEESEEEGFNEYDLQSLVDDFAGFVSDNPVLILDEDDGWKGTQEYQILLDQYLYLKKNQAGAFKIIYKKDVMRITMSTSNSFEIELDVEVANIMPLLMAYRVFKDDEPAKAVQYYNEYMQARNEIKQKQTLRESISVIKGEYDGL
jgi:hypothetical protein